MQKKIFQNNIVGYDNILEAIKLAESFLVRDSALMTEILYKSDWKYRTPPMPMLAQMLFAEKETIKLFTYRPFWPYSKAIAYYKNNTINFNIYKLYKLSVKEIAATLVHEKMHQLGFSHGSNRITKDKLIYSVPYFASEFILNS